MELLGAHPDEPEQEQEEQSKVDELIAHANEQQEALASKDPEVGPGEVNEAPPPVDAVRSVTGFTLKPPISDIEKDFNTLISSLKSMQDRLSMEGNSAARKVGALAEEIEAKRLHFVSSILPKTK